MSKKTVSPMWLPVGPEVWHQSPRQAALVLSQLPTDFCVEECAQQASATARVVRTLDYGGLHRPPTGRPKWLQPADASSNHCALVATADSPGGRVLCGPPSDPRWYLSGSPERSVCGDGCGPLRRGVCGPRNGGRPCAPAAVLHHPGPPRVNSFQCDRRWQPARDPDLAPSVADDRHSTLSGPHPTSRPQLVSPVAQTSRRPSTARLVSPRHGDPHCGRAGSVRRSGAGVGVPIRGSAWHARPNAGGFSAISNVPAVCYSPPCRTCFTISTIQ